MAEHKASSRYDTCYQAPLYLYDGKGRTANVDSKLLVELSNKHGRSVKPEEVFYYVYAVGHSPTYRSKFDHELKSDYPRIPFTADSAVFDKMVALGKRLAELHLGKADVQPKTKYDVPGTNIVEKVSYSAGKVMINKSQYFASVPQDIWDFRIGGYEVLDKWLKSRKGRTLEGPDIEEFMKIVEIIRETIAIMEQIDAVPFLPRESPIV